MNENVNNYGRKEIMNEDKSKKKKILTGVICAVSVFVVILLLLLLGNEKVQYEVTFDSNGGTLVETLMVDENGYVKKPKDPTREGYMFAGWYYNDELFDFSKPITSDITLVARWVELVNVSGIQLNETELTLGVGKKFKLIATIIPENAKDKSLTWSSSNPDVVSVDKAGNITALKPGTATITVATKDGKHKAEVKVTVVENNVSVTGVSLNKTNLSLKTNETVRLIATVNPSNATNKGVTWSSSNTNVVTVDSNGNVTARGAGTATITVTTKDGNYKATCTVTVSNVNVTGVSLNKTSLSLYVDDTETLVATVNPGNATNKGVTWSSSNTNVVIVDSNGKVTAKGFGTATITVKTNDGNHVATCTVTVSERPASYVVVFTPIVQEGTGAILQYSIAVQKNGSAFNDYSKIIYDGKPTGTYLAADRYNRNITSVSIILSDNTNVNATVVYNN